MMLETAFRRISPRLNPKPIAPLGAVMTAAIALFWGLAFVSAFRSHSLAAWSMGVAFIVYDLAQLLFVAVQARKLFLASAHTTISRTVGLGVIVAAYNEATALPATLDALLGQTEPPQEIWIADDGSSDDSAAVLAARYGLEAPATGEVATSHAAPSLRWLRLPHRGKARALNAALERVGTEVVVTVDADTLPARDAIANLARAFAADPDLIVAGGVLEPRCRGGGFAKAMQAFQRLEYVRNFLNRFAWTPSNSLVLVSGAFAGFRTQALREIGGFDPDCLVEDYELIHRLHRYAREAGGVAKIRILGDAFASTDAPAELAPFLRQRRRWFAGFLQTQYWNRDMIGAPRYGALGLAMLPVKHLDAAAPLYGLAAFALLAVFLVTGRGSALLPASGLALTKLGVDLANMAYCLEAYRRWTGGRATRHRLAFAWGLLLIEPFSFQPLRQLGAALGWGAWLRGRMEWGKASRDAQGRTAKNSNTPVL